MRPLTKDMLDYAALDTMYLPDLRDRLKEALEGAGRWGWAREEFTRLEATRWQPDDDATAFLRMKGARDLNRRELAVLRELVIWRNGVAEKLDLDTGVLCARERLEAVARAKPESLEDFDRIPELRRWQVEVLAAGFLEALKRHTGGAAKKNDPPPPVAEAEDRSP